MRNSILILQVSAMAIMVAAASCVVTTKSADPPAVPATATATATATVPATTPEATTTGPRVVKLPPKFGTTTPAATTPTATTTATTPVPTTTTTGTTPVPTTSALPGVNQAQCVAPLVWDGTKCTYSLPPGGRPPG